MSAVPEPQGGVRVWDPLVRIFHWTLATAFLGAFLFEDPRALHRSFGYVAVGAVAVRIVWGLVGPGHARFADFVPTPAGFLAYVRDSRAGRERRYLGHNPAGGAMVVALLAVVLTPGRHRLDDGNRRLLGRRPDQGGSRGRGQPRRSGLWRCTSRG